MKKIDPEDYLCLGAHSIQGVQTGVVVWSPGLISPLILCCPIMRVTCNYCTSISFRASSTYFLGDEKLAKELMLS